MYEIDIGNLKTRTFTFRYETFYYLWVKRFFDMRRERDTIFLCWLLLHRQLSTQPIAHKVVWPRRAPKVILLPPRQEINSLKSQPTLPVHDVVHTSWFLFPIWGFILTSVNDASSLLVREHLRSCLHLTNPCTKRKVLIPTKPKGKISKTKSLRHYITIGLTTLETTNDYNYFH